MVGVQVPSGWIVSSAQHRILLSVTASLTAGANTTVPMEKKQGLSAEVIGVSLTI